METEWISNPDVSRRSVLHSERNLTVYFALARKRQLAKSTLASHDRCVRTASCGFEREDGSRAMVDSAVMVVGFVGEDHLCLSLTMCCHVKKALSHIDADKFAYIV
jgi:hypothetical protein